MTNKSSFKNHNSLVRALVVAVDEANAKLQVWIPAYHEPLSNYSLMNDGSNYYSGLPWALMCTDILGTKSSSILGITLSSRSILPFMPEVGDIVWVGFEGGDIRYPIYIGTLRAGDNTVSTTDTYDPSMVQGGTLSSITVDAYIDSGLTSFQSYSVNSNNSYDAFGLFLWQDSDLGSIISLINENSKSTAKKELGSSYEYIMNVVSSGLNKFSVSEAYATPIINLLSSKAGIEAQKSYAATQMKKYLMEATTAGMTKSSMKAMYALLRMKFSTDVITSEVITNLSACTSLDAMHVYLLNLQWSIPQLYIIESIYQTLSKYESTGKFQIEASSPGVSTSTSTSSSTSSGITLDWVVPSCTNITQQFGHTDYDSNHRGIDISQWNITGQPVIAPCDGIIKVTQSAYSSPYPLDASYGNCCDLLLTDTTVIPQSTLDTGIALRYAHLSQLKVSQGQQVTRGQVLGLVGNTGNSSGAHLHLEVLLNYNTDKWNGYVNPIYYFNLTNS